jgi:hypothetical protein
MLGLYHCLRGKVRKGAELVTGEYGNCLKEDSPLNKGKSGYTQVSKETVTVDCERVTEPKQQSKTVT